jgi:uncharacterized protein
MPTIVLCAWALLVAAPGVADLTDPRPTGLVLDHAGVIDDATEARLGASLEALRRDAGAEVAVVTVADVDGTPKAFATALFNRWQLGHADRNDGVLVLMVMGKRRLEVETGDGIEGALPAWWLADMQAQRMVPRFKQGDVGGGLEAGVAAIGERLRALPGETERDQQPHEYRSDGEVHDGAGGTGSTRRVVPAEPPPPGPPPGAISTPRDDGASTGTIVLGVSGGGLALGGGWFVGRAIKRRRRRCGPCQRDMFKLDEVADDEHLDGGQRTEERIGSVDYEVLICRGCQATRIIRHGRWFSGKNRCPGCRYKTMSRYSGTLVEATYDHGGSVRVTETCAHCSWRNAYTRSTARLTPPSDDSSSSYSSSSSSYSSSSSSSSSSGGGHSSGGGAGSSW